MPSYNHCHSSADPLAPKCDSLETLESHHCRSHRDRRKRNIRRFLRKMSSDVTQVSTLALSALCARTVQNFAQGELSSPTSRLQEQPASKIDVLGLRVEVASVQRCIELTRAEIQQFLSQNKTVERLLVSVPLSPHSLIWKQNSNFILEATLKSNILALSPALLCSLSGLRLEHLIIPTLVSKRPTPRQHTGWRSHIRSTARRGEEREFLVGRQRKFGVVGAASFCIEWDLPPGV
jgi:hypothetical protein